MRSTRAQAMSLAVDRGECLAIVGRVRIGQDRTVANMMLGIYPPTSGEIRLNGTPLPQRRKLEHRRAIQLVQQNPLSSLNPSASIGASLRLALDVHGIGARAERADLVGALLTKWAFRRTSPNGRRRPCPAGSASGWRSPGRLPASRACGAGRADIRARCAGAGAGAASCSTTCARRRDLTYRLHHPRPVRGAQHRHPHRGVRKGRMVELGDTETLFANPEHPYTRRLISAVPVVTT
jgi:ABC-type glutathione transport system ATPase component